MFDNFDRKVLAELQQDASLPLDELGDRVGLSRNACWRRIKRLEDAGVIKARVAILDAESLNVGLTAFISVRTTQHDPDWLNAFRRAVQDVPEIVGVYRTTGDIDYLLQAALPDVAAYDKLYKLLISRIPLSDVSSFFDYGEH